MKYLIFLIGFLLASCDESQKPNSKPVVEKSVQSPSPFIAHKANSDSLKKEQIEYEKQTLRDSIQAENMLGQMLKIAAKNTVKSYFTKKVREKDSDAYTLMRMGNLFSKTKRHVFIRCFIPPTTVSLNIYSIENGGFKNIFTYKDWPMVFTGDTIRDVNGDGYKDFIHSLYASSGCCARDDNRVSLYNKDTGGFYDEIEFVNPTFSPSEKIIRGVEYGHPGEVPLYKYRWNGAKVDTIEYIYPADTIKKKFYVVKNWIDLKDPKKRKLITSIPKEYLKTNGYYWFINY